MLKNVVKGGGFKFVIASSVMLSFILLGCGSSSDSEETSESSTNKSETLLPACSISSDNNVSIPSSGCSVKLSFLNGGKGVNLKCEGGKVNVNGISGGSVKLNGYTFKCK